MRSTPVLVALLLAGALAGGVHGAEKVFPGPNGKLLLVAPRGGGNQLYATSTAATSATRLTSLRTAGVQSPQASASGARIVFDRCSTPSACDVWVMNANGSKAHALTRTGQDFSPAWSRDGTRIAFWRCPSPSTCRLSVVRAAGGAAHALASGTGPEYGGSGFSWSADGKRIAFSRNNGTSGPGSQPTADIFTVGSAGGGQRQLTRTRDADDVNPVYSPGGKRIAWELRDHEDPHPGGCSKAVPANESQEIWAMNTNGSRAFALTSHAPPCDFAPAWSPNGKKILFGQSNAAVRSAPGQVALSTMNTDGGDQRVLVPTTRGPVNGVWSPNGTTVAFTGALPAGVFVVRATGGTPARVRSAPGGSTVVDWARVPVR